MKKDSNGVCLCPLEGIITTIAKKWAIQVISALRHHDRLRFNDLMSTLEGISPKSLTDLLKELQRKALSDEKHFPKCLQESNIF